MQNHIRLLRFHSNKNNPHQKHYIALLSLEQQREAHAEMYVYLYHHWDAIYCVSTWYVQHTRRTSNVAKSEDNFETCDISEHQNKASINAYNYMSVRPTLYEIWHIPSVGLRSAKMEQTERRMKIYFQLCRGAAHFRYWVAKV